MRRVTYLAAPILALIAGCTETAPAPDPNATPAVESPSAATLSETSTPLSNQSAPRAIPNDVTYTIIDEVEVTDYRPVDFALGYLGRHPYPISMD